MISMTRLLGSAAVLTLTANAHAVTLIGTYSTYQSDFLGAPEILLNSGEIDSGEFVFTDLSGGAGFGNAELTVVFTDVSYATLDDSGNPFAPGAEPLYLSSIKVHLLGTSMANADSHTLLGSFVATNTIVGCTDIDPGACNVGPAGSSANDFINFFVPSASTPGWASGQTLDFSAGVTVSSVIDLSGIDAGVSRVEFTLFDAATVPVPAAVWFFGSGLMGLVALNRKRSKRS